MVVAMIRSMLAIPYICRMDLSNDSVKILTCSRSISGDVMDILFNRTFSGLFFIRRLGGRSYSTSPFFACSLAAALVLPRTRRRRLSGHYHQPRPGSGTVSLQAHNNMAQLSHSKHSSYYAGKRHSLHLRQLTRMQRLSILNVHFSLFGFYGYCPCVNHLLTEQPERHDSTL